MSNQFLKLRRSAVPGRIPTTSSLDLGEIALNTYDGLAFMKKSGSSGEQIVTLGTGTGGGSGNITGSQYFIPVFNSTSSLITSSFYQSSSFTGLRTTTPSSTSSIDILLVDGTEVDTYNIIGGHGNLDNFIQLNIQNFSSGANASSDIVATNDAGDGQFNYIDMGINSSQYSANIVGGSNDAYLYSTGNDLYIGNARANQKIVIFNGGFDVNANAKIYIHPEGVMGINTNTFNATNPAAITVRPTNATTNNLIQAVSSVDNYTQISVANESTGTTASADIVAYNNIDPTNQLAGFIDMGIASTNYVRSNIYPSAAGDAYVFTDSHHLLLGAISASGATKITLFAGGINEIDNAKLILFGNNQHQMTGSLSATQGFTGSLFGTASWARNALTSSIATSSSFATNSTSASFATTASYISASNIAGLSLSQITLGAVTASVNAGSNIFNIISGSNTLVVVDNTGSVGIGTTSPGYKLDVQGTLKIGVRPGIGGQQAITFTHSDVYNTINSAAWTFVQSGLGLFLGAGGGQSVYLGVNGADELSDVAIGYLSWQSKNASAILDIKSTTKGFLPPRMTAAQRTAISSPARGLLVYDIDSTTEGLWFYNSGSTPGWQEVLTNTGSQSILGGLTATSFTGSLFGTSSWATNALTASYISASGVIGLNLSQISLGVVTASVNTGNNVFNIISGSNTLVVVDGTGSVGIGTTSPGYKLDVSGTGRFTGQLSANDFASTSANGFSVSGLGGMARAGFPTSAIYLTAAFGSRPYLYVHDAGSVTITTAASFTAIASSILTLDSTTKGFLPTRTDLTSNISAPAQGLITYLTGSTNEGLWYYSSGSIKAWTRLLNDTGSQSISGSLTAISFTGSLQGTASWANNAVTSSYILNAVSASFASTASYVLNAVSASFASTASSADNFLVRGTLTAQTIVAQTITSSTDFVTGSTRFGSLLSNTHQFTGSVSITGSLAMDGNINVTPDKIISAGGGGSAQAGVSMWGTQNSGLGWDGFFGRSLYYSGSNYIYSSTNASSLWGTVAGIRVLGSGTSALQFIARPATEQGLNVVASDIGSYTRMTILYDGSVGIGTISPSYRLDVSGSSRFVGDMVIAGSGATSGTNALLVQNSSAVSTLIARNDGRILNGDSTFYVDRYTVGGTTMVISNTGHNGATGIQVTSAVGIKAYSNLGVSANNTLGASIYAAGGNTNSPTNISLGLLSNRALITSTASGMNMHTSSMLQVDSTDQGFLPPRMTAAQRTTIGTPARGLLVYDVDSVTEGLWIYNSGSTPGWQEVLTNSGSQSISGSITAISFTGSLFGTSSWATNALTASYANSPFDIGIAEFNSTSSTTTAGTTAISSINTGSFTSAFYNYTISSGSNARAGQVMSVWSGTTVRYTEVTTTDIGNTATASFAVAISGANVNLNFTAPGVWTVKSIANLL